MESDKEVDAAAAEIREAAMGWWRERPWYAKAAYAALAGLGALVTLALAALGLALALAAACAGLAVLAAWGLRELWRGIVRWVDADPYAGPGNWRDGE